MFAQKYIAPIIILTDDERTKTRYNAQCARWINGRRACDETAAAVYLVTGRVVPLRIISAERGVSVWRWTSVEQSTRIINPPVCRFGYNRRGYVGLAERRSGGVHRCRAESRAPTMARAWPWLLAAVLLVLTSESSAIDLEHALGAIQGAFDGANAMNVSCSVAIWDTSASGLRAVMRQVC